MIIIENDNVTGWDVAIRGMRNPMNSWDRSDSEYHDSEYVIGDNDLLLMQQLCCKSADHSKYLRYITVTADITAPLYWWKEFDTYKVGTVSNSCSTMHKIHTQPLTLDNFSTDHLTTQSEIMLKGLINLINKYRLKYLDTNNKLDWWQIIQLLPTSYNQRRTIQLNYQVLRNMYRARHSHKLDEWRGFCLWTESLPHSELILGGHNCEY